MRTINVIETLTDILDEAKAAKPLEIPTGLGGHTMTVGVPAIRYVKSLNEGTDEGVMASYLAEQITGDHLYLQTWAEFLASLEARIVKEREKHDEALARPLNIYVASSWRNPTQPAVVTALRAAGHDCYDFRHPAPDNDGFAWSQIDPEWQGWSPKRYREILEHPIAKAGFALDMGALQACDVCVYVLPCGRSASLELGWAVGAGKYTVAILADGEPELMLAMVDRICLTTEEAILALADYEKAGRKRQIGASGVELAECLHCTGITVAPQSDKCACGAELYPVSRTVRPGTRINGASLIQVDPPAKG